ncbi:MAG TPA: ribonuclease P protein component [Polyangiaceae bacterium]|nr:ribonuclease P protein component [Polyangiaceae bacterium]
MAPSKASTASDPSAAARTRFDRARRVRKRWEFVAIQGRGKRVHTPHCTLLLRCRQDTSGARLGLTVSKKVGNSVTRSRVKRVLREAFRATQELWPPDVDLVVIPRKSAASVKPADIVAQWLAARVDIDRKISMARREALSAESDVRAREPRR